MIKVMIKKFAVTSQPIDELLAKRWSLRAFDINKPVSRQQIISICEAGRWAPSCFGDEPWRFMVWDINHDKEAYRRAFSCIGKWNQKWVRTAPVIMASLADNIFRKNGEPNRWGQHDTGLATENILLQAFSLGLAAHPMGGFDGDKLKTEFNIPDRFTPMAFIAIGYQDDVNVLGPEHAAEEIKPRVRLPLGDTFFDSSWEKGII
jgi:nitroreductase